MMNKPILSNLCGTKQRSQHLARTTLCLFVLLGFNNGHADDASALADLLPQSCFLSGDFQQTKQLAEIPRPLDSSGEFIFNCQQGLIWVTTEPHRETLVYRRDGRHHVLIPGSKPQPLKGRIHRELGLILNNLIGADVDYLQQHFTVAANSEDSYQLVPNNKRLRDYIASINIAKSSTGTNIAIDQGENESMTITIQKTQEFSELTIEQCGDNFPHQHQACTFLFQ